MLLPPKKFLGENFETKSGINWKATSLKSIIRIIKLEINMKKDLDVVDKKISILIKSILLIFLIIILLVILGLAGYWGYSKIKDTQQKNKAKKHTEETVAQQNALKNDLSNIKHIGEEANLGDLKLKLLEEKKIATLPSNNKTGLLKENERNVIGLKFKVMNNTGDDKYFSRKMGWLATEDNPAQAVNVYPFSGDEYVKQLGESYTFDNRDLLVKPNETKETWIALEVDTSLVNPVFLYPPTEPNSKWSITN